MKGKSWIYSILQMAVIVFLMSCAGVQVDETAIVRERMLRENTSEVFFPVGYEDFHEDKSINYLLNRLHSYGYALMEDMVDAGIKITDFQSVLKVMDDLSVKAEAEGRHMNAAMYIRAIEFYTGWDDPEKTSLYERFVKQFYMAVEKDAFEINDVKYGMGNLATLKVGSEEKNTKGTIIMHAGYDGFKEELYPAMRYLASHGYDVIGFDVPWMGRSKELSDESFSYEWEKVIGAVLDHYEINDAAIIGISFGGWLALRAAAFEPRITRVVASSVSFDVNQYASPFEQKIARFALKHMRGFTNKQILKQMEKDPQAAWFYDHLMHITRKETPLEAAESLSQINEENLHSELVTQDVMIQTGLDDHLVPFKMHNLQVEALINAKSVTPLVFTEEVQGQNHCQVGNFGLALDLILDWLDKKGTNG
ncbi:MAG: alpha/beta fold hydrolase [Spirochaetales bacterium]|jgi:pimeloyl-ACP methyl ester carboxylesterase|nr:alpha/beta fold hydrolase [Spirochaetales bacterium]